MNHSIETDEYARYLSSSSRIFLRVNCEWVIYIYTTKKMVENRVDCHSPRKSNQSIFYLKLLKYRNSSISPLINRPAIDIESSHQNHMEMKCSAELIQISCKSYDWSPFAARCFHAITNKGRLRIPAFQFNRYLSVRGKISLGAQKKGANQLY